VENILVQVKTKSDSKLIFDIVRKMGFDSFVVSDFDRRMLARKKLVQIASTIKKMNISDEEISEVVESVRSKRYSNGKNKNNN
jgi:hypothetical protein